MFDPLERIPLPELSLRHDRVRALLAETAPGTTGLLCFSRANCYYLSGTIAGAMLWLPLEGEPALLARQSHERARLESSLGHVLRFRSYSDIQPLLAEAGVPLAGTVAAETGGLSWKLADMLRSRLAGVEFTPGDMALAIARSRKTEWELNKLRLAGARHNKVLYELLPQRIEPGMTERDVARAIWELYFSLGHGGLMRMSDPGEELFLGLVSAGDSGNYPSVFPGPLGARGEHPATPFMGYAGKVWSKGEPLTVDNGFVVEGYSSDKTQVYWAGPRGSIPAEAARAHDFCIRVQEAAARELIPGAVPSRLWAMSLEMAEKEGMLEGYMALGNNKVRFLGHGIGLAVDEYPALAAGFDRPLEEGAVIALEPKMGIPGLGMVGVENTYEVTPHGGRCITGDSYEIVCIE